MALEFLDKAGATLIVQKIKTLLTGKVDVEEGKGLSTNDYTTEEKGKLAGVEANANNYVHPDYTSRNAGLYKTTVDASGHVSEVAAVEKADIVALGIPESDTTYEPATGDAAGLMSAADFTKLSAFEDASSYALKADMANVYHYKGSVADASELPVSNQTVGDVYNIVAASDYGPAGANVAWTEDEEWDPLGGIFAVDSIGTEEIDNMFA